ncbi:pentapeptide repeat-containing protein [Candidatus Trichorickettsia mobilis]|uniref:pentapeptide repeat-containing protein n=1 Tax=Candidatus Trichorickettsia mobilis TaxID=1346319 RepID=UPI00292F78FB|nr:pentapeptide repeat-containing protein [Candidatus Trichorickettsia mobilis]
MTALQQDNLKSLSEETSSKTQPFLQEAYGLDKAKAGALAGIVPILLDSPKDLKTVFDGFQAGNYTKMTTDLLSMVDKKPEIAEYFKGNRDIFVDVLNKTFENTPALKDLNLKGELYDIVPALLKHPKELTDIINIQNTGNYGEVGKKFIDLVQSDPEIKGYFTEKGGLLAQISTKAMGMEAYGIKDDEVGKIFERLMDKENAPKLQGVLESYQKGEWTKVIISTCDLIDKDPQFKQYMKDNKENFAKIVTAVIDRSPNFKSYTNGADVGHVASGILENPKVIKDLVEGYEKYANSKGKIETVVAATSIGVAGLKIAAQNAGAIYGAVTGWISGADSAKQNLVNGIVQELSAVDRSNVTEPLKLNDLVKNSIANSNLNQENQIKVDALINKNILFDGVNIKDSKLENLTIEGNSFVNSTIEKTSFKNTVFSNVGFNGAKLKEVDFAGATIDATTLKNMLDSVKKGGIALDGVKIVGDISGVDLSGVSLKGADLSKVTAMKDVNLKDTNLTDGKFPENQKLLTDTYNLDKAVVTVGAIAPETIKEQQNKVVDKAVEQIASVADTVGEKKMSIEQKTNLGLTIKELIQDGGVVGKYIQDGLSATPNDAINKNFPIKPEQISHVADYNGKTNNMMTILLDNKDGDRKTISNAVAANVIADIVTTNLFQDGKDRGKDGLLIKEAMKQVVTKFTQENPGADLNKSLGTPEGQNLIGEISKELQSKTKYTTIGKVTGGIYLPPEAITEPLVNKLKVQMNDSCGTTKFNEQELANIRTMADKIGTNLFGTGTEGARKSDTKLIEQNLKDTFYQLKKENKGIDLSDTISQQTGELVGTVDKRLISTARTGLTELYYKNSTYTSAGMIGTGGIYLDEAKIGKEDFSGKIKQMVKDSVQPSIDKKVKMSELAEQAMIQNPEIKGLIKPQTGDKSHHQEIPINQDLKKKNPSVTER